MGDYFMTSHVDFDGILSLDAETEIQRITLAMRQQVKTDLRRRGSIVGLSGGVDSSVVAALCHKAFGSTRTLAIIMPDRDSSPDSVRLAKLVAKQFGLQFVLIDITSKLEALGCYEYQDAAIRKIIPSYQRGWKFKIAISSLLNTRSLTYFTIIAQNLDGEIYKARLDGDSYKELIAATNIKQRARKLIEYYYADLYSYAVIGTPNFQEYDQGFFVKQGDGAADLKPIAHLYKSQVYLLARHLQLPEEICSREPSTDTYSLAQTQEEFFFALPYRDLDVCLCAVKYDIPASRTAAYLGLREEQVLRIYSDIEAKRRNSSYLHAQPLLIDRIGS